jgi:hypothetical protein
MRDSRVTITTSDPRAMTAGIRSERLAKLEISAFFLRCNTPARR